MQWSENMHYIKAKSILSPNGGMNLYRGCSHGCIYCDSRSRIYNMDHDFEDIAVKENAIELLQKTLKGKREKCMIGTGSMTDPYIPLENDLNYIRKSLELIYRYGFGFTCITKSDLVLRDLELIKKINEKTKAVIQMTMTTYDEDLCRKLEPNVAGTYRRFEVLKKLSDNNIPTIVWLCPILPFINDTDDNINGILDYCIDANVKGIICFGMGTTLREGNREYFYKKLDDDFPGIKDKYIKTYGNSYGLESPNSRRLMRIFKKRTEEHGMMNDPGEIFKYLHEFPKKESTRQTTLF